MLVRNCRPWTCSNVRLVCLLCLPAVGVGGVSSFGGFLGVVVCCCWACFSMRRRSMPMMSRAFLGTSVGASIVAVGSAVGGSVGGVIVAIVLPSLVRFLGFVFVQLCFR